MSSRKKNGIGITVMLFLLAAIFLVSPKQISSRANAQSGAQKSQILASDKEKCSKTELDDTKQEIYTCRTSCFGDCCTTTCLLDDGSSCYCRCCSFGQITNCNGTCC